MKKTYYINILIWLGLLASCDINPVRLPPTYPITYSEELKRLRHHPDKEELLEYKKVYIGICRDKDVGTVILKNGKKYGGRISRSGTKIIIQVGGLEPKSVRRDDVWEIKMLKDRYLVGFLEHVKNIRTKQEMYYVHGFQNLGQTIEGAILPKGRTYLYDKGESLKYIGNFTFGESLWVIFKRLTYSTLEPYTIHRVSYKHLEWDVRKHGRKITAIWLEDYEKLPRDEW